MGKMILFVGKEFPAGNDMASGASFQGRKVIASSNVPPAEKEGEGDNNGEVQKAGGGARGAPDGTGPGGIKRKTGKDGAAAAALFYGRMDPPDNRSAEALKHALLRESDKNRAFQAVCLRIFVVA